MNVLRVQLPTLRCEYSNKNRVMGELGYDSIVGVVGEEWLLEMEGRLPLSEGLENPVSETVDAGLGNMSTRSVEGDEIVGDMRLRIELVADLLRDMYGLGCGFGLEFSVTIGDEGVGVRGDLSPVPAGKFGSGIPLTISTPYSSVRGRGGGRSTIASRSCVAMLDNDTISFLDLRTSFRNSSPAYSPSISSGPRSTCPFLKTSPSSSTQLRDL